MLFQLVIALVLICVAAGASHLRGEAVSEDVPLNQALFDRYAAHMFPKANATRTAKQLDIKMASKAEVSAMTSRFKKSLGATTGSYFVTRKYRNGDCSGTVTETNGIRLNSCIQNTFGDGFGNAFAHKCTAGDTTTVPHTKKYSSAGTVFNFYNSDQPPDCPAGFGFEVPVFEAGNKCELDSDYVPYHGYQMRSATCGESFPATFTPGLVSVYGGLPCAFGDSPTAFRHEPFGVCELFVDHRNNYGEFGYNTMDESTDFFYIKKVSCDANGQVLVHAYSDPACSRKMFRGVMNMHQHPMFLSCDYDPELEMFGTMFCHSAEP